MAKIARVAKNVCMLAHLSRITPALALFALAPNREILARPIVAVRLG
jgi:hypothetical protein